MRTIKHLVGVILISTAVMLGLNVGMASAATESRAETTSRSAQTMDGPFIPVECRAINLAANVSNHGIGYIFSAKCNPAHYIVVEVNWYDAAGNILWHHSAPFDRRPAGTWSTYSDTAQRPWNGNNQTSYACIWVTQHTTRWLGGPVLTSGCFPRNS